MSTLYVVATPLGNRGDFTDRAREVLSTAQYVFAEDTRSTKKLLGLYGLEPKGELISYHARSHGEKEERVLELLREPETVAALVTDAGTPAISDPGARLIALVREKIPGCTIVPVPGPSAITALLSVAGLPNHRFSFWGFIPQKKGRSTFFEKLLRSDLPVVCYESPHRILKTLETLSRIAPDRMMVIGREMTKHFEEYPRETASALYHYYKNNPQKTKGEFAFVFFGKE